jgi:hypothetical protein
MLDTIPTDARDLAIAMNDGTPLRIAVVGNKAHNTRGACDKCSRPARYAGLGGSWCAGCWSIRKKQYGPLIDDVATALAHRYGVHSPEHVVDCLSDASGFVRIRAASAPARILRYHPHPATLVERLVGGEAPHQRVDLQLSILARAIWGVALSWGADLDGYPRDHHHPDDIPWGVVRWAESDIRAYRWLITVAMRLRAARCARYGSDSEAVEQISWLLEHTSPPAVGTSRRPLSPPPGVHIERDVRAA